MKKKQGSKKIRYAVVGLGWFAQEAILPAFRNARKNSELVALVSGEDKKLKKLGKVYGVKKLYSYDDYPQLLTSGEVDAVYIALPNDLHRDFAVKALEAGIHVLCEKPMALNSAECQSMIDSAEKTQSKLMIAYRLHFEESNLTAVDAIHSGKLGDPRIFNSLFTFPIKKGNIRTRPMNVGGGPLYDIGVYCINASRYLFRDEPEEVFAYSANGQSSVKGPDTFSVMMRFPGERLGTFTISYSAATSGFYEVIGTKGDICVDNAYEFKGAMHHWLTVKEKTRERDFKSRDQIAPELLYFSNCILKNVSPEPSGEEGLADLRVIEAIEESVRTRVPVRLEVNTSLQSGLRRKKRPSLKQEIRAPEQAEAVQTGDVDDPHQKEVDQKEVA